MNQPPPIHSGVQEYVPNHLVWAILSTLFCCLPLGIVSIVYAAKVDGLRAAGDIAGARTASDKAKFWAWWSLGAWAGLVALYLLFFVVLGVAGALGGAN